MIKNQHINQNSFNFLSAVLCKKHKIDLLSIQFDGNFMNLKILKQFSPLKNSQLPLLIKITIVVVMENIQMRKVVKAKNLIAFRIWLEKLGYSVKNLADNKGFTFCFKKEYGLVTCDLSGNNLAIQLGEELEDHLKA